MLITYPDSNNLSAYAGCDTAGLCRKAMDERAQHCTSYEAVHCLVNECNDRLTAALPASNKLNHEFQPRRRRGGRREGRRPEESTPSVTFNLIGYKPHRNKHFREFKGQGAAPNARRHRQGPSQT